MRLILALLILAAGLGGISLGHERDVPTKAEREANLKAEIEQAEETLKKAKVKLDTDSLLTFFKQRTLLPKDEEKLNQLIHQLGDNSYPNRVIATSQLLKAGSLAMPFLQKGLKATDQEIVRRAELCLRHLLENSDSEQIVSAAFLLAQKKPDGAAKAMLDFLPFATDEEVTKQVREALVKIAIKDSTPDPALVAALKDKFAIRRGAAGEALASDPNQRAAVLELLKDPDPGVRLMVSLALLKAQDERALPVLIALLDQLPEEEIWQAEESLLRLAGETAPSIDVAKDIKPGEVRKGWEQWQKDNTDKLKGLLKDFAKGDAFLNYILITQMPLQGGINGEVLEIDPKANTRWSISGLRYPVDAQVVGAKRVLVAEYLNRKVVEMDFKGDVKWSFEIDQPVGCQLLPNGNIFIAGRRQIVEVTRDHKQKFSHGSPNLFISTARKLPNGEMMMVDNNGRLTHLDPNGKELNSFTVGRVYTLGGHIDVLPGKRVLVPEYSNHKVVEYTFDGKVKWQVQVNSPTSAVRLPNGHTLVTSMINQQVIKFDHKGNEVWTYKTTGRPWCARAR